jgi:UDP-glucose 4-epimerase
MRVASLRCPLPFSGAIAPRSMISAVNLADALLACALAPQANGRTYFVADSEDLTVAGLLASLRRLEGRSPGLFFVAPLLLRRLAAAIGRGDAAARLFDSLQLDCSRIRGELGWSPPQATMTGLADTLAWYHQARR